MPVLSFVLCGRLEGKDAGVLHPTHGALVVAERYVGDLTGVRVLDVCIR
jgi:hypothetical protein